MFTHILSTIPHIRLTGLSVEGITGKKHTRFFQASTVWYGAIMKMAFIAGQPGVQIIGFSEQHRLEQPHKDLDTSPTTDPHHHPAGQPEVYSICPQQALHTPLQVWSARHKHTINVRRRVSRNNLKRQVCMKSQAFLPNTRAITARVLFFSSFFW